MRILEILPDFTSLTIRLFGAGSLITLLILSGGWWKKHISILSTLFIMALITVGLSITMVVLFLFPSHRKPPHHDALE